MKSIIIGNGINIQYGGLEYTNKSIIERALHTLKTESFSKEVYTKEIETWIYTLYAAIPSFIEGQYDRWAVFDYEKEELESFKIQYKKDVSISDIGFEYFFLLNELYCRKNNINNPERYHFQEFLGRVFLDGIYNRGEINTIYANIPASIVAFINAFDAIFTTNYDRNVEWARKRKVLYLHGAFHVLDPVYDPNSFRNQLSDRPVDIAPVIKGYEHAFSNAITGSSGALKLFQASQYESANSVLDGFAKGMEKPEIRAQIEQWKNSDDQLLKNLYEAIDIKRKQPDLKFSIDYALDRLKDLNGEITFIGLSPNNDAHIMKLIKENIEIPTITFYYFDPAEATSIKSFFDNKKVLTKDIRILWKL